ncbi:hypothetical protein K469DRAFT_686162 [Zopfia rhizophila CBS 207.26]|uniref:Uncharacterized protein n=1 Tax=Zopfia rhizophila CBS 207.26 TaxID=1314779 RepID=A0A6A6E9W8_9PEZI|nr:hypothetical protein K469DRAFT_686162 [Zopfia rhizophila CBS 207.26]
MSGLSKAVVAHRISCLRWCRSRKDRRSCLKREPQQDDRQGNLSRGNQYDSSGCMGNTRINLWGMLCLVLLWWRTRTSWIPMAGGWIAGGGRKDQPGPLKKGDCFRSHASCRVRSGCREEEFVEDGDGLRGVGGEPSGPSSTGNSSYMIQNMKNALPDAKTTVPKPN